MTDDLRDRGIKARDKLVLTGSQEAGDEMEAWERECVSAYPSLEFLGPIPPDEQEWAEELVQQRTPDFTIAHPSTYFLDADTIEATAFTNAVRVYRLQQSDIKPQRAAKRGKPVSGKPYRDKQDAWAYEMVRQRGRPERNVADEIAGNEGIKTESVLRGVRESRARSRKP